jgi:hypothetical protein
MLRIRSRLLLILKIRVTSTPLSCMGSLNGLAQKYRCDIFQVLWRIKFCCNTCHVNAGMCCVYVCVCMYICMYACTYVCKND